MKWKKKSLIYCPKKDQLLTHASIPVGCLVNNGNLRIFYSSRDDLGRSNIYFLETNPKHPEKINFINKEPILRFGEIGTFDDNGLMPSCVVEHDKKYYMYYIGWNPQVTVTYRLSIGLATSNDGKTFERFSQGPLLDRSLDEPYFNTAPCVIKEDNKWKMWYVSCTRWVIIDGYPEPQYYIRYAESNDGILWKKFDNPCISYNHETEAIARPWVFTHENKHFMLYSYRDIRKYRTNVTNSYKIGLATSNDGIAWKRDDNYSGISCSKSGWDSDMICYPMVYKYDGCLYLLYNGNGFGKTGFGYAVLEEDT